MSGSETSRRFHVIREIATGGFGSVYLTKIIHGDGFTRLAAMKLLHPKWSENEEIASRMRDEARLLGWLRHRNIVDVLDLTRIDGRVAVVMEYLEAIDIKVIVKALAHKHQRMPLRVALEVCTAAASALDAAYNRPPYVGEKPLRVIHRDIKPSNIMVDESGLVKVLDFGVARADFDSRESHTKEMAFGSIEYMPPERLFFEPESHYSDVYSLGATLYEMLAQEKLGKARLRPDEHERWIDERWEALARDLQVEREETAWDLRQLLYDMVAFDAEDRPSGSDCVVRMRALSRSLTTEPGLAEWAEVFVPPVVHAFQSRQRSGPPDPLVDKVLREDSQTFDLQTADETGPVTPEPHEVIDDLTEEEPVHTGVEDDRWEALKAATLKEIGLTPPPAPRLDPPPSAPRAPARRPAQDRSAPPPRAPQQAEHAPPAREEDEPSWLLVVAMLLMGGLSVFAGASALSATVVWVFEPVEAVAAAVPELDLEPEVVPEPPVEEEPALDVAPAEPHASFASLVPDTKRIIVRCAVGDGSGDAVAYVVGAVPGRCSVTVVDEARSRYMAVVDDVAAGQAWQCFGPESDTCVEAP